MASPLSSLEYAFSGSRTASWRCLGAVRSVDGSGRNGTDLKKRLGIEEDIIPPKPVVPAERRGSG
jgi:hypothetical protein